MDGQKITVTLASKPFSFTAKSPEEESLIRFAAEQIERSLKDLSAGYPSMSMEDKLAIVALRTCCSKLAYSKRLSDIDKEKKTLLDEIQDYLKNIDESGR